jgi:hypothetical protein
VEGYYAGIAGVIEQTKDWKGMRRTKENKEEGRERSEEEATDLIWI